MIVAAMASLFVAGCCKNCKCDKPDCNCGCKEGKACTCAKVEETKDAVKKAGEVAKDAAKTVDQAKAAAAQAKDAKKPAK